MWSMWSGQSSLAYYGMESVAGLHHTTSSPTKLTGKTKKEGKHPLPPLVAFIGILLHFKGPCGRNFRFLILGVFVLQEDPILIQSS